MMVTNVLALIFQFGSPILYPNMAAIFAINRYATICELKFGSIVGISCRLYERIDCERLIFGLFTFHFVYSYILHATSTLCFHTFKICSFIKSNRWLQQKWVTFYNEWFNVWFLGIWTLLDKQSIIYITSAHIFNI